MRRDDVGGDPARRGGHLGLALRGRVGVLVEFHPEYAESSEHRGAQRGTVLADATGEGNGIEAAHCRGIRADVLDESMDDDVEREQAILVAVLGAIEDGPEVVDAGEAEQAA